MKRRKFLGYNTCCAASSILLSGRFSDDDVHILETEMKVMGDNIVIGVWVTNPTGEKVVPVIHVEGGDTYADSGELPIDPKSNATVEFSWEASWGLSATEVSYSAWLSGVTS